jgi:hypothetical protein
VAIPLPHLDDRTFAELLDEARALLPSLAPAWTSHNPSDPGITLVELFAWLAEMLVWRTGQLPDASVRTFLKLLNGPGWTGGGEVADEVAATVAGLRDGYRAVTPADYERLIMADFNAWLAAARAEEAAGGSLAEWTRVLGAGGDGAAAAPSAVAPIARARCVPRRDLDAGTEAERAADAPGEVSVLVLPRRGGGPAADAGEDRPPPPLSGAAPPRADDATRRAVWAFLEERRLLGTRVHVVSPVQVPVRVEAVVVRRPDAPEPAAPEVLRASWERVAATDVRRGVLEALAAWLDPLRGGPGAAGWPFGRDVHVSDLYALLEAVPGVDHVVELRLYSSCADADPACVAAAEVRHPESGEQVGLALAAHHLPRAALRPEDVHVAAAVVPVRVLVSLTPAAGVPDEALARAVDAAVRRVFGPLDGGPDGDAAVDVRAADVRAALRARAEVDERQFVHVRFESEPGRLLSPTVAESHAVRFHNREVAGVEVVPPWTDGRRLWS